MKTIIIQILKKINQALNNWSLNYIDKVTKTLYPKPHLYDERSEENDDDEDDDPILFL